MTRWELLVDELGALKTLVPSQPTPAVGKHLRHAQFIIDNYDEEALAWVPGWNHIFCDALELHVIQLTRIVVDLSGVLPV